MTLLFGKIKKSSEFKRILRKKMMLNSHSLTVFSAFPNEKKRSCLGIIITKKNLKQSNKRNKIRRQIKNIFNDVLKNKEKNFFLINGNFDFIIIVKKNFFQLGFSEKKEEINSIFSEKNLTKISKRI